MNNILEKIYNDVCLDDRIPDGVFDVYNNDHMAIMREYLVNRGIEESAAREFSNLVLEKGKYPERQAYNKDGILVTFPSREYKQRAIKRGTHFDKDPTKGRSSLFQKDKGEKSPQEKGDDKQGDTTELPPSDKSSTSPPGATAPDTGAGDADQTQTSTAPSPGGEEDQPIQSDPSPPDVKPPKSPEEKEEDREAIKAIVQSNNSTLGIPELEEIKKNLPALTERNDSIVVQFKDLIEIANKLGMKEAAAAIRKFLL